MRLRYTKRIRVRLASTNRIRVRLCAERHAVSPGEASSEVTGVTSARALRADAQVNQDRVLEAAAAAFGEPGADTSMKAIARSAGVGIGTLYRRFPTREQLIDATYRNETIRLAESADALLAAQSPASALRSWMDGFTDYILTKHGMAEALPAILASTDGLRTHSRDLLRDAIARLLVAGAEASSVRASIDPSDVLMALGGITLIADNEHQRDLASRLCDLLMDALTANIGGPDAAP
jgi:AcrR family transcriptional regulator